MNDPLYGSFKRNTKQSKESLHTYTRHPTDGASTIYIVHRQIFIKSTKIKMSDRVLVLLSQIQCSTEVQMKNQFIHANTKQTSLKWRQVQLMPRPKCN